MIEKRYGAVYPEIIRKKLLKCMSKLPVELLAHSLSHCKYIQYISCPLEFIGNYSLGHTVIFAVYYGYHMLYEMSYDFFICLYHIIIDEFKLHIL